MQAEASQLSLERHLRRVLARLEANTTPQDEPILPAPASPEACEQGAALEALCERLGLSPFERDVLIMSVGVELDSRFHTVCDAKGGPTLALAMSALEDPHWRALSPSSPLRRWRLVDLAPAYSTVQAVLRLDETMLPYLFGEALDDPRLGAVRSSSHEEPLSPSQRSLVDQIISLWRPDFDLGPVLQLVAVEDGAPTLEIASQVGAGLGFSGLIPISAAALPATAAELELVVRLCERQARLNRQLVLLAGSFDQTEATVNRFIESLDAPLIYATPSRKRAAARAFSTFDVKKPTRIEQQQLWTQALGARDAATAAKMSWQFHLSAAAIASIAEEAALDPTADPGGGLGSAVWAVSRRRTRPRLDDLASRITALGGWDDLILPDEQMRMLRIVAAQAALRARVHDDWGFASKSDRGLGLTALFAGSSGTGKTTAAEVLAQDLNLDLYRVDLSAIVSKFIGETEKNLRQLFDTAEEGGVVLLFDEADALFGKRTDVKDSHDRNANIEVSYLLQRIETFKGLAILTTNMRQSIDQAFLRRFRFIINFPFPDERQRARIWRANIPVQADQDELDIGRLAKLALSGGQIRSVALNAAFLAAAEKRAIGMDHLRTAAQLEHGKQEKPQGGIDFDNWPL